MAEDNDFIWKYESILDHDPTREEFEGITGFKWEKRLEYLQSCVFCDEAGARDIEELFSRRGEKELARKYGEKAVKCPEVIDYCGD